MSFLEILVIRICYLPAFYFTGCDQSLINGLSGDLGFINLCLRSVTDGVPRVAKHLSLHRSLLRE